MAKKPVKVKSHVRGKSLKQIGRARSLKTMFPAKVKAHRRKKPRR